MASSREPATFTGNSLVNTVNLTADIDDLAWRPRIGFVDRGYLVLPD